MLEHGFILLARLPLAVIGADPDVIDPGMLDQIVHIREKSLRPGRFCGSLYAIGAQVTAPITPPRSASNLRTRSVLLRGLGDSALALA